MHGMQIIHRRDSFLYVTQRNSPLTNLCDRITLRRDWTWNAGQGSPQRLPPHRQPPPPLQPPMAYGLTIGTERANILQVCYLYNCGSYKP